jgi:Holliday junction resolvase
MSGGRSPKRKGTRVERKLVNELVELGLPAFRVPLSGAAGGQWSGDIHIPLLGRTRRVEVKARGTGFRQLYAWLNKADLLIVKADRCNPLAVLPLALVVELMVAAERGSKASTSDEQPRLIS